MIQFNQEVKVLGYVLSEEERQLKRQWSQENHERMVDLKNQVRRQKAFLNKYRKSYDNVTSYPTVIPYDSDTYSGFTVAKDRFSPQKKQTMDRFYVDKQEIKRVISQECDTISDVCFSLLSATTKLFSSMIECHVYPHDNSLDSFLSHENGTFCNLRNTIVPELRHSISSRFCL